MRYAFSFDASACTGCKACQVACKDKHALPPGLLWRRVYEVSGGAWERQGAAWANTVFAYNVSVGCNHCADPACAAACPTDAYVVRDDGIVWLDEEKCIGCEYCAWVCPYGAPQYSSQLGRMTKCDGCRDLIDDGLAPSCVSACPLRALEWKRLDEAVESLKYPPFPLPAASRTRPQLAVNPHPAMLNDLPKAVANYEEVRRSDARFQMPDTRYERGQKPPYLASGTWHLASSARDLPLVFFTLLAQAAAGAAVISLFTPSLSRPLVATIGALIAAAALVSLLHLGVAPHAWRAASNLKRSALSREILMLGLFAMAWAVAAIAPRIGALTLAAAGVGLVYNMAQVYRVDVVPGWRVWPTRLAFAASALLLGAAAVLATSAAAHPWVFAAVATAVFIDQAVRRSRFYGARLQKTM